MTTPKEKAKELVDNFTLVGLQRRNEVIQCALIAVDEILDNVMMWWEIPVKDPYFITQKNYWSEVRQEIDKL